MGTIDILIVAAYFVGMIALGLYSRKKVTNMDDFVLSGRQLGVFTLVSTIMATMVGTGMTMGSVSNAYRLGATGTVLWAFGGFGLGLIAFAFMTGKVRETGKRTMAEVISSKFGKTSRLISAIVLVGYAIALMAINIAGLRTVIIAIGGEALQISIPMATAIAAAVAIFYGSIGGFFAVARLDRFQLMIIILGIIILGPVISVGYAGGLAPIAETFTSMGLSLTNPLYTGLSTAALGFFLAMFVTVPGDPSMPQRALAGKSNSTTKKAFIISGFIAFAMGISLLLVGAATQVLHPGLENPDVALAHLILNNYPTILMGFTVAALFAAVISSFDSFMILGSTHLIYDIGGYMGLKADEKQVKKITSVATVVMGIIALIIALFITELFAYLYMVFSILGSSLVPTFIAGLFFADKVSRVAANASMIIGAIVPVFLFLTYGWDVFLGDPIFIGMFFSIATLVILSVVVKDKDKPQKES